jgi:hypothetical protein
MLNRFFSVAWNAGSFVGSDLAMNDTPSDSPGHATFYVDGKKVERLTEPTPPPKILNRPTHTLDPNKLRGPKLKIERAECHIAELERANRAFFERKPYRISTDIDSKSGERIFRVGLTEPLPSKISAILGDIIHNIRSTLDHLVCDLIRANKREPDGGSGFPITQRRKNLKPGTVTKIEGVSPKAERLILRLKPYEAGNPALWKIHMLDVLDKHAGIIPVAAATGRVIINIPAPMNLAVGPGGRMSIGSTPARFQATCSQRSCRDVQTRSPS